jgi:hypothetical protein
MANNFPTIRPSLNMQFANTGVLPPDVTFTRASQSGGYYDGKTVVKAEENLLLQSQTFDNASWTNTDAAVTVTANTATAPDGTLTADTMAEIASTASFAKQQAPSLIANTTYTISCFVENVDVQYVGLNCFGASNNYVYAEFDLTGLSVNRSAALGTGWSIVATSITASTEGFYRIVLTFTTGSIVTTPRARVFLSDGVGSVTTNGIPSYTGTNKSANLWGAQLEQRDFATAYTPTTTQPITNYIPKLLFAPANVPVFDHNPVTGEALGLSVWEARTNLLLRSQEFETTWTNEESSEAANVVIAPDGTLTADKLIPNTNNVGHWINQTVTVSSIAYTFSFFAKADGYSIVQILNSNSANDRINFDLSNGTVGSALNYTGTITSVGNGWYRCTGTFTATAGTGGWARIGIVPLSTSLRGAAFAGNGTSGVLIWGAQLEAGAFATPYIPTVASTVARSADAAVMTGVNFSRWYRQDEGSFVAEFVAALDTSTRNRVLSASDAAGNLTIDWITSTSGQVTFEVFNGSTQAGLDCGVFSSTVFNKVSGSYKVNSFNAVLNGGTVQTDTTGAVPAGIDRLGIGIYGSATGSTVLNGYIKSLSYYRIALTSAQHQAVTA